MTSKTNELLSRATRELRDLRARVARAERDVHAPIAVVGVGCRLPGGVRSPEDLWQLVEDKNIAISELPAWRWPPVEAAPSGTRWAGLLEQPYAFDASFFGIAPRESSSVDPQQAMALELSWEALEHAGIDPHELAGQPVGVFMGVAATDHAELVDQDGEMETDAYAITGTRQSFVSGRIAYALGLRGPTLSVDTACSSALVAVHLACRALRNRECGSALAGGVSLILSRRKMLQLAALQALSPDGRCWTYDVRANGFVRAEGGAVVVLKRLEDAQADGDRVLAVIRGSAILHDGRSNGITAPNLDAQVEVIRAALRDAGLGPDRYGYIEGHGTGTSLGDSVELLALAEVLAEVEPTRTCAVGSIKANLGHTEAAAGVVGMIHAINVLRHGQVLPHPDFSALNPHVGPNAGVLRVVSGDRPTRLPPGATVGVSSFGLSGTNAHVVLDAGPPPTSSERDEAPPGSHGLLVLSAASEESLARKVRRTAAFLERRQEMDAVGWADACNASVSRRAQLPHRLAVVATTPTSAMDALCRHLAGAHVDEIVAGVAKPHRKLRPVFVFPGQGGQWVGMGRQLYRALAGFRSCWDAFDEVVTAAEGWSPTRALHDTDQTDHRAFGGTRIVQPLLFGISICLARCYRECGVRPSVAVGHSMGEIAAAHVAGALTLEDAARLICRRSHAIDTVGPAGGMIVVELGAGEAERVGRRAGLELAAINGPRTTVLSGDRSACALVLEQLAARGVFCRSIDVDYASHSSHMESVNETIRSELERIEPSNGEIPLWSTTDDGFVDGVALRAEYWQRNLRRPVMFADAVRVLAERGYGPFIELGPNPVLAPSMQDVITEASLASEVFHALEKKLGEERSFLHGLGRAFVCGAQLDAAGAGGGRRPPVVDFPRYPWVDTRMPGRPDERLSAGATSSRAGRAPGSSKVVRSSVIEGLHHWEPALSPAHWRELREHVVGGVAVLSAAVQLALVFEAAWACFGHELPTLRAVKLLHAITVGEGDDTELQVVFRSGVGRATRFDLAARSSPDEAWEVRTRGVLTVDDAEPPIVTRPTARSRTQRREPDALYARLVDLGIQYGESQRVVHWWYADGRRVEGRVGSTAAEPRWRRRAWAIEGALQILAASMAEHSLPVPVEIARVAIGSESSDLSLSVEAVVEERDGRSVGTVVGIAEGGRVGLTLDGVEMRSVDASTDHRLAGCIYDVEYEPLSEDSLEGADSDGHLAGRWLVLTEKFADADGLAERIRGSGATVEIVAGRSAEASISESLDWHGVIDLRRAGPGAANLDDPGAVEASIHRQVSLLARLRERGQRHHPRMVVVTRGAWNPTRRHPSGHAEVFGLCRTILLEVPECRLQHVHLCASSADVEARRLAALIVGHPTVSEAIVHDTGVSVPRLVRRPPEGPRRSTLALGACPVRVEVPAPGSIERLRVRTFERTAPGAGQVEIEVLATSLNFIDLLSVLGSYPEQAPVDPELGSEVAGRVVRTGAGVVDVSIGAVVLGFVRHGLATHAIADRDDVVVLPDEIDPSRAVAVPSAFMTAWHSLYELARVERGESILVHSATGGTGLATLELAKAAGLRVFATASSPEKRRMLEELGCECVWDSRMLDFRDGIEEMTAGRGVDVVLNSLTGAAVDASLACLADGGRFLELGKVAIHSDQYLSLSSFRKRLGFFAVDLAGLRRARPHRFRRLFRAVMDDLFAGRISLPRSCTWKLGDVHEALRHMSRARAIGRQVVVYEGHVEAEDDALQDWPATGTTLITGGLGDLGLGFCQWLADRGGTHVVLLGRNAPNPHQQQVLETLQARGIHVRVEVGDVADFETVRSVVDGIEARGPRLRTVIHAAGVVSDRAIDEMDDVTIRAVCGPKLRGAVNLDLATRDCELQAFVLFGSAASILGSPGQAHYAAANAFFMDLVEARHRIGRPATCVSWGRIADTALTSDPLVGARLTARGLHPLALRVALDALSVAVREGRAHAVIMAYEPVQWVESNPRASAFVSKLSSPGEIRGGASLFVQQLRATRPAERPAALIQLVRREVAQASRLDLESLPIDVPFRELGLDSLMALEIRNRLEAALGVRISAAALWSHPTVTALAEAILPRLGLANDPATEPEDVPAQARSDDDLEAELMDRLARLEERLR